jgi:phosphoribosyl 1,2-cyclic phosphodiesterase
MKIKVWGCRGSLPAPGLHTLRYGGHTTCLEIRGQSGGVIVVVAGSGIRNLGQALEKGARHLHLIITHSHWDHLLGFPFFAPAYFRDWTITLCGGPNAQDSLRKYLHRQMKAPYFPVDFSVMKAQFKFGCASPKGGRIGSVKIVAIPLNHPNGGFGFRFTEKGRSFVFLTDNELDFHHPGGLSRDDYREFCQGADLLFHDAQYTDRDYLKTRGWGHSTFASATDLAIAAGVKQLGLFHHDPDRSDGELDKQVSFCQRRIAKANAQIKCFAAAEGMTIRV